MFEPAIEALPWEAQARHRRRPLSPAGRLPLRQFPLLSRQARRGRLRLARGGRRARPHRQPADDREGRDPRRPATTTSRSARTSAYRLRRDRAHLLDQRHHRHPELHPADGHRRRQLDAHLGPHLFRRRHPARRRPGLDLWRRAVRRRDHLRRLQPDGRHAHPDRRRQHRAPDDARSRLLKPDALALTPSYALHLAEWAQERGIDLRGSSVTKLLIGGEPGGGEPAMRGQLEDAWGARVTEVMGIGDIAASMWGECPEQGGMHFSARGLVHVELIDPATGEARDDRATAPRANSSTPTSPRRRCRCSASGAATMSASRPGAAPAAARRRASAASAAPTTC